MKLARLPLAAVLAALALLVAGSLAQAAAGLRRAEAVSELLRAMLAEPGPVANRVFPCMAGPLKSAGSRSLALEALEALKTSELTPEQDTHLLGTAYCLLGEAEAGRNLFETGGESPYLQVQRAVLAGQQGRSEESARLLAEASLDPQEAVSILAILIEELPDHDWRPHLRLFASQIPQDARFWQMWLEYGAQLGMLDRWAEALAWYQEGADLQTTNGECLLCSVFLLRSGRIYQMRPGLRDLEKALYYYELALASHDEFQTKEGDLAHLYLGEVYLGLPDRYSPQDALSEFEKALELDPQSYWALIDIGRLQMENLNDLHQAESFFQAARGIDPNTPYTYTMLGDLNRARGDPAQAEAWYRQALGRQPDYQPALDRLKELGANP